MAGFLLSPCVLLAHNTYLLNITLHILHITYIDEMFDEIINALFADSCSLPCYVFGASFLSGNLIEEWVLRLLAFELL